MNEGRNRIWKWEVLLEEFLLESSSNGYMIFFSLTIFPESCVYVCVCVYRYTSIYIYIYIYNYQYIDNRYRHIHIYTHTYIHNCIFLFEF